MHNLTASDWIVGALVLLNLSLVITIIFDCLYRKKRLKKLKEDRKKDDEEVDEEDLKDEIEPKQVFAWIYGSVICLNILLIGAVVTNYWADNFFKVAESDNNKALFGDSFGAVNALVSAFAFAGMIVAFILQRYELKLQRKELKAQRNEFNKQNETLRLQRFENTFFHMMELQQQIVAGLRFQTKQIVELRKETSEEIKGYRNEQTPVDFEISGRGIFSWSFRKMLHEVKVGPNKQTINGMKTVLSEYGFQEYINQVSATMYDHYFRHLYTILKFIDKHDTLLTPPEQYEYAKILRATLSRYELVWLYYNGLSNYGNEKLKPLIEKYCMLKNLREDLLVCSKENLRVLSKAGVSLTQVKLDEYTGTDYEFFLTAKHGDKTKYHISAFYNTMQDLANAEKLVNNWQQYLDYKRKQAKALADRVFNKESNKDDIIAIN